jgi:hypothetical protein
MEFFQSFKNKPSPVATEEERDAIDVAIAPLKDMGKQVTKMLDKFAHRHPDSPVVNEVTIRITSNGTFPEFPADLSATLVHDIKQECGDVIMEIVGSANDLRVSLGSGAMPFVATFYMEAYHGEKGFFYKMDRMEATTAGLPFSASMVAKLFLIASQVKFGDPEVYNVIDKRSDRVTHKVHAGCSKEAYLKAAATVLTLTDMKELITTRAISDHRALQLENLEVSSRNLDLFAELTLQSYDRTKASRAIVA